jgi:hypothetical protein
MADPPPYPDAGDGTDLELGCGSITGAPRWVKVLGIIAAVLVLLIVIMVLTELLTGQGPARHMFGGLGGQTPPSSGALFSGVGGHMPLAGGHAP